MRNQANVEYEKARIYKDLCDGTLRDVRRITWAEFARDDVSKIRGKVSRSITKKTLERFGEFCKPGSPKRPPECLFGGFPIAKFGHYRASNRDAAGAPTGFTASPGTISLALRDCSVAPIWGKPVSERLTMLVAACCIIDGASYVFRERQAARVGGHFRPSSLDREHSSEDLRFTLMHLVLLSINKKTPSATRIPACS